MRWALTVPLLFSAMLVSSMYAMRYNSLGTVAVFRNVAPLITLPIERLFRVPVLVSRDTVLSLLTVIVGVALYYGTTLELSLLGFLLILLNMTLAVLERLLQRHLLSNDPVDMSKSAMMLLNNAVGILPNMLLLLPVGEIWQWHDVLGGVSRRGWAFIFLSCNNGVAISWAGLKAQQLVTATTFMVLTNVNKFVVILFGVLILGEACSPMATAGVMLAIGGALWYANERRILMSDKGNAAMHKDKDRLGMAEEGGDDDAHVEEDALLPRSPHRQSLLTPESPHPTPRPPHLTPYWSPTLPDTRGWGETERECNVR